MGLIAQSIASQMRVQGQAERRRAREKIRQKSRTHSAMLVGFFAWRYWDGSRYSTPSIDHRIGHESTFLSLGLLVLFVTAGVRETARAAIAAGVEPRFVAHCAGVANRYSRTILKRSLAP